MNENEGDRKVKVLINDLLAERQMSLRELARLSGIEPSYLEHIERIADALDIDDISRILKLSRNV